MLLLLKRNAKVPALHMSSTRTRIGQITHRRTQRCDYKVVESIDCSEANNQYQYLKTECIPSPFQLPFLTKGFNRVDEVFLLPDLSNICPKKMMQCLGWNIMAPVEAISVPTSLPQTKHGFENARTLRWYEATRLRNHKLPNPLWSQTISLFSYAR